MTGKRFYVAESNLIDGYCVFDREKKYAFNPQEKKENCMSTCKVLNELHEEKELWKRECKRLKGLYYLENGNVELEDIIGLVKTDEQTNSVELKKEAQLSICEKRVLELEKENEQLRHDATILIQSNQDYRRENEQLKEIINQLFNTITELDWAKEEYCNALIRLLGEENDVDKAKQRIREFLE